jgi:hypothetical protein
MLPQAEIQFEYISENINSVQLKQRPELVLGLYLGYNEAILDLHEESKGLGFTCSWFILGSYLTHT